MNTSMHIPGVKSASSRPRPVLMIPVRRCGSHALRLRLNFNPRFFSPYPLHIVDFMPLVPLYGNLADDDAYFRMVVDVVGLQAASMVKWPDTAFDPIDIFESICDEPRSVHRIVWEMLLRAGERHKAKVVMDKSLDSVQYADELMRLFPDMLFLNVVRDPRAQVASMNKAIIHEFDTLLNARIWVDAHRSACELLARYPDRVLTIRYEDFLSNQEKTLMKVCTFFEIDFLPQMLDVTRSAEANQIAKLSALWMSNCYSPIVANADKFKKQLSMDEIEMVETLAQQYMRLYGYEMMTNARATVDDKVLGIARARSDAGREIAWRDLREKNFRDYTLRRYRADYLARVRAGLEAARGMAGHATRSAVA
ncbi:MAG TPA: sulfotransferase [Noviherbaspirillum sp.]|uniref:sulfotransferase family protein n=1 Tax=Noviherbaspirillum sp. TaxID=1926288 RepID=UPI002DDD18B3|nr:sulfotransferase [Noviherbaspirillum sp.]HEV2609997.1 sulfotransferase [Noviherbaspirillum sp.]